MAPLQPSFNQRLIKSRECCGPVGSLHQSDPYSACPKTGCLGGGRADEGSSVATAASLTRKAFLLLRIAGQYKIYVLSRDHYCASRASRLGVKWKAAVILASAFSQRSLICTHWLTLENWIRTPSSSVWLTIKQNPAHTLVCVVMITCYDCYRLTDDIQADWAGSWAKGKARGDHEECFLECQEVRQQSLLLWMTTAKERESVFPGRHLHCFQSAAPSPMSGVRVVFAVHFVREDMRKSWYHRGF